MAWPIFRGLFDDASLFPPASLAMADAVAGHLRHQAAWYREMSGPFVCADTKITELSAALTAAASPSSTSRSCCQAASRVWTRRWTAYFLTRGCGCAQSNCPPLPA